MMQVEKAVTFGVFALLLAVTAACADQPLTPRTAADGPRASGAVGPLAVSISGPPTVYQPGTYMWQTYASGGDGTYAYVWERRAQGSSYWTYVGSGSIYYGSVGSEGPFELRATAYSGGLSGSQTYAVNISYLYASISGPTSIAAGTSGTWTASATGGVTTYGYAYDWYYRPANSGTWTYVGSGSSYTRYVSTSATSFTLRVRAMAGVEAFAEHYVHVQGGGSGGGGGGGGGCSSCPQIN